MVTNTSHLTANPYVVFDKSDKVIEAVYALAKRRVYVGIPSTTAGRTDIPISNAALGYIHEFGDPATNLPARPFLRPGVKSVEMQTIEGLKRAAKSAVNGNMDAMEKQFMAVGQRAASAVQRVIQQRIPPPLADRTVRARLSKTKAGQTRMKKLLASGTSLTGWGAANLTPLLDTGQLLKSITYVVK